MSPKPISGMKEASEPGKEQDIPAVVRVVRITVDEKFDQSLIRFLVADLKLEAADESGMITTDRLLEPDVWEEENERLLTLEEGKSLMAILLTKSIEQVLREIFGKVNGSFTEEHLWASLEEGQLFLSGNFEVIGERIAPEGIRVAEKLPMEFFRIDRLKPVRLGLGRRYTDAVRASARKGKER